MELPKRYKASSTDQAEIKIAIAILREFSGESKILGYAL